MAADGGVPGARHTAYVAHPEAENYSKHLLTLLAQRRELQSEDVRRLLEAAANDRPPPLNIPNSPSGASPGPSGSLSSAAPLPASLFSGTATAASIDRERRDLQAELGIGLEWRAAPTLVESVRAAVHGAGQPLGGLPDTTALTWHFRARQAELAIESRAALRHVVALRRQHFGHSAARQLPREVTAGAGTAARALAGLAPQLDAAGSAWRGELRPCGCDRELALAAQCMQAVQLSEADTAARLARLTTLRAADESDWWAALHWAACRLPAGRPAERFFERLRLLPLSHHHRFPIYEQVAGAALRRDQHAASTGLRLPPRVVTGNAESQAVVEALFSGFDLDEIMPQSSQSSSDSLPMTVQTDNSAKHHKAAYDARRILPRVLARHRRRWPGATPTAPPQRQGGPQAQASGVTGQGEGEQPVSPRLDDESSPLDPFADDPACSSRDQVVVVRVMEEQLAALVPSLEGDESAGVAAAMRTLPLQIDEALRAENDFIDETDERVVHDRLRSLAEAHVDRWSVKDADDDAAPAARMTLSLANQGRVSAALQDKTLEALYLVRFLATKRNKIRVLHHLNAIASLQLQLLRDERDEEGLAQPFPTTANKDFTCPIAFAAGTAATVATGLPPGAAAAGGGSGGSGADSDGAADAGPPDPAMEFDTWLEDPEAGVSVRDPNGRWILYGAAVDRFRALEAELLRVATFHLEAYAAQLSAANTTAAAAHRRGASPVTGASAGGGPGGGGGGDPLAAVDRLGVVADLWECEAQFAAARHRALLAYFQAYRHATCWGMPDMWGGASEDVVPFGAAAALSGNPAGAEAVAAWRTAAANSPQPQLLGARRQLRREIIDLTFRRPALALEDGYFAERYHADTLALELEATLAGQLASLAAGAERQALAAAFHSAHAAASAAALLATGAPGGAAAAAVSAGDAEALWKPGYSAGIVYGGVLMVGQRGLMQEGATLAAVGAAVAALPAAVRSAASALAAAHQLRHHVELADLRRAVLQHGVTEMGLLLREEAHRAHAPTERQPKDSMYDKSRGRKDLHPDAPLLRGNWLCASHVADNPEVLRATALEAGVEARAALEVFLNKEALIRSLYRGEVLWLVYVVQARALGRKVLYGELYGIDWGQIDAAGNALKAELLNEVVQNVEPADIDPPGAAGPGSYDDVAAGAVGPAPAKSGGGKAGGGRKSRGPGGHADDEDEEAEGGHGAGGAAAAGVQGAGQDGGAAEEEEEEEVTAKAPSHASAKLLMVAVGTGGCLGGVWRSPPLALSEFSTSPAEQLNPHSLAGLRAMLTPGEAANGCLAAAVRAQVLRAVALEVSIRHNQVLLDGIVRKLDRRRRVLMWRMAAMEGGTDEKAMDVVVGGPPGSYAPSHHPLAPPERGPQPDEEEHRPPPPLLRDPPGGKLDEYAKQRRSSSTSVSSRSRGGGGPGGAAPRSGLDDKALDDLKQRRRALTAAAGALYLDICEIKLRLRVQARRSYVQGLVRAKGGSSGHAGPEVEAAVRADTEAGYAGSLLAELLPAAARTQLAAAVRDLAVLVLGGTGGYGADWGVRYDADGLLVGAKEDRGPLFQGPDGQAALRAAVLEYAPLWQNIAFALADKPGDPDPMDWSPAGPAGGLPNALCFLQLPASTLSPAGSGPNGVPPSPARAAAGFAGFSTGGGASAAGTAVGAGAGAGPGQALVRLECLWGLPGQWDVLHAAGVHYPPGPVGLAALDKGCAVAGLLVEVVRHFLYSASLMAPSSLLAAGGDVSGTTAGLAPLTRSGAPAATALSYNAQAVTGPKLYEQTEVRMLAAACSLLPGALLAADLVKLQARLQYLHRQQTWPGPRPTGAAAAGAPSATQPADDVLAALRRELGLLAACRVLAAARARDGFMLAGAAKRTSWYLTGCLEHLLSRTAARGFTPAEASSQGGAAPPPPSLPAFPAAFALRLPDPDRLAIHNESGRIALALERLLAEARIPAATAPHDALAASEYFVAGMWVHDRLRDALVWRSLLMESPEAYPFSPPHVGAYLRRHHSPAPPLAPCLFPPAAAVEALRACYGAKVMTQARTLLAQAEAHLAAKAAARAGGRGDDGDGGGREAAPEGKPSWLAASPCWACPEVRLLEACVAASKQHLDLQAVQVALLRLNQDCGQLAGLQAAVSAQRPGSSTGMLGAAGAQAPGPSSGALHPHTVPASALGLLARKLMARQRRGGNTGADAVVELSLDEVTRWLAEAATTLTASARAGVAAVAAAGGRERRTLGRLADELEGAVGSLATETDTFIRRHATKVETQLVDRAMALLQELSQARRSALRNAEDSRRAMEAAYGAAQKQYAAHIDDLNNQLIVARTNSSIMRSELQKAALEALIEVRRETLNRAFAGGSMKMTDEVGRMLALERQLEESQTEILDLQRAISKVQAWFKMRSSAFLTACMTEVAAARARAESLEAELWEGRERAELAMEQLATQLKATQADLESLSAGAARNASDLRHALASNKKLLKWKVTTAPRVEALKMKMAEMTKHREAWLEWINSKQGLMQQIGSRVMAAHRAQQEAAAGGPAGAGRGGGGGGRGRGGAVTARVRGPGAGAGAGAEYAEDWELEAIREQWELERRQMQAEVSRLRTELSNERLVKNDVFERLMRLEQQYTALAGSQQAAGAGAGGAGGAGGGGGAAAGGGGGGGGGNAVYGRSALSPLQADILSRRYEELKSSHESVREENAALRRTLAALRSVAPDLVASLEFPLLLHGGGGAGAGQAGGGPGGLGVSVPAGAGSVPGLRGSAPPGSPGAVAPAPGMAVAGALRPGTAGRLRTAPGAGAAGDGLSSPVGSPARKGVGAAGARPPSAATYALRAAAGQGPAAAAAAIAASMAARPGSALRSTHASALPAPPALAAVGSGASLGGGGGGGTDSGPTSPSGHGAVVVTPRGAHLGMLGGTGGSGGSLGHAAIDRLGSSGSVPSSRDLTAACAKLELFALGEYELDASSCSQLLELGVVVRSAKFIDLTLRAGIATQTSTSEPARAGTALDGQPSGCSDPRRLSAVALASAVGAIRHAADAMQYAEEILCSRGPEARSLMQYLTTTPVLGALRSATQFVAKVVWPAAVEMSAADPAIGQQPARHDPQLHMRSAAGARDVGSQMLANVANALSFVLRLSAGPGMARTLPALHESRLLQALSVAVVQAPPDRSPTARPASGPSRPSCYAFQMATCQLELAWNLLNFLRDAAADRGKEAAAALKLLTSPEVLALQRELLRQIALYGETGMEVVVHPEGPTGAPLPEGAGAPVETVVKGGGSGSGAEGQAQRALGPMFLRLAEGVIAPVYEASNSAPSATAAVTRFTKAAEQLFPSRTEMADLAARAVRSLCMHLEPDPALIDRATTPLREVVEVRMRGASAEENHASQPALLAMHAGALRVLAVAGPRVPPKSVTTALAALARRLQGREGHPSLPPTQPAVGCADFKMADFPPAVLQSCVDRLLPTGLAPSLDALVRRLAAGGQAEAAALSMRASLGGLLGPLLCAQLLGWRERVLERVRADSGAEWGAAPAGPPAEEGGVEVVLPLGDEAEDLPSVQGELGLLVSMAKTMRAEAARRSAGQQPSGTPELLEEESAWYALALTSCTVACSPGGLPDALPQLVLPSEREEGVTPEAWAAAERRLDAGRLAVWEAMCLCGTAAMQLTTHQLEATAKHLSRVTSAECERLQAPNPAIDHQSRMKRLVARMASIAYSTTMSSCTFLLPEALLAAETQCAFKALGRLGGEILRLLDESAQSGGRARGAAGPDLSSDVQSALKEMGAAVVALSANEQLRSACVPGWLWGTAKREGPFGPPHRTEQGGT
ncbi:hypothetical protein HYH03_004245 [Edaphochlamys debaryana]|uniref:Uncharacterized protein n=1 Tax=Edaphochlamys debaryana TaxID=47281 RepID=A0A835Y8I0_9CHLO|nr:hypothetical protein HYH03_004245 [Edaphochlamys debaryana]|eukprot:KAG2497986.1 hypothetical protein HYH03_004245 [Edaphochlamys debaryana]